jgi:Tol biopolymer transport system component
MCASFDFAGSDIGHYRVVSLLGTGGMGEVYDAIDSSLGRHVALKVLKSDAVADPKRLSRFVQEARTAAALNHPHLVSIYEIGEHAGVHFIAMEKIDGSTLRQIFSSQRLPLIRALDLMVQITEAVAAAHAAGIVHRDLKPENIMVSRAGYAKVLDFGLAKLQPETVLPTDASASTLLKATDSGTILGTVGYMSPEQAQGKPADARSDIFSLACILYEGVTGTRAFRGQSSVDTLHKIINEDAVPLAQSLPNAPNELQRILRKAMAKDPEQRYQSSKDFALDLRGLLRDLASASSLPSLDRPSRRRSPLLVIALAAILIFIAAAVVIIWRPTPRAPMAPAAFQRLTAKGNLGTTRISADGRFIAYAQIEETGESLWLRQLATGEDLQLVPRVAATFLGCAFTPDGNAIVYALESATERRGAFYRVSTIGGPPDRLLSGTDSAPAFAPDGKRMAWLRAEFPKSAESALMIANSDGTGERILAIRRYPELFAPIFFARPSWSPDGKLIAASVKRVQSPDSATLMGFDPDSGREKLLSDAHWVSLSALEWLPDQTGIVAIGANDAAAIHAITLTGTQIWLIPYPSGAPRRITNDLLYYREISVSADGGKLVADVADATVHIWRNSFARLGSPQRISSGHLDGVAGISTMRDGRFVFASIERGTTTLWTMDADGGRRRQLIRNPFREEYPVSFSGGIAYVGTTPMATELCVTSSDGDGRRVVVSGVDDAPIAVSPDGTSFVYSVNRRLWKTSADGRERHQLTQEIAWTSVYSPNGDRIAFITVDAKEKENDHLVIMHADGSRVVWSSPVLPWRDANWLRWNNDGTALLLGYWTHNVWLYPLQGQPKQLTNFDEQIWSFDVSSDKVLFVARGSVTRDAVLITGFR